jgi:hypothetical protein
MNNSNKITGAIAKTFIVHTVAVVQLRKVMRGTAPTSAATNRSATADQNYSLSR